MYVKLGSLNASGLGNFTKRKSVLNFIKRSKIDICYLQETHLDAPLIERLNHEWHGSVLASAGDTRARGVVILVKPRLEIKINTVSTDDDGRIVCVQGEVMDKTVVLCNIYAPNIDDPTFFTRVIQKIESFQNRDIIIIGGNFNLVMEPHIDRHESGYNQYQGLEIIKEYMNRQELVDIWRVRNAQERKYSWCRDKVNKKGFSASRIDMFLVSNSYADCVGECKIGPGHRSDHSFVTMDINLATFKRGPGSWKLNNKLLLEQEYIGKIKETIAAVIADTPLMNPNDRWCEIKIQCAKTSKAYGRFKSSERRSELKNLEVLRDFLIEDQIRNNFPPETKNSLDQIQNKIEHLDMLCTEGSIFRSKCAWAEYGEKNSKMFFSLEKNKYMAKNMKCVITDAGRHITDQKSILDEQTKFYKSLYSKDH